MKNINDKGGLSRGIEFQDLEVGRQKFIHSVRDTEHEGTGATVDYYIHQLKRFTHLN